MTKHSKNNTARGVFSYHEKQKAKWGSQKLRYGADSLLPFASCFLCQQPAIEPHATPSGHMYCKECIFKYLLQKNLELKKARELYAQQQERLMHEKEEELVQRHSVGVQAFIDRETKSTGSKDSSVFHVGSSAASSSTTPTVRANNHNDESFSTHKSSTSTAIVPLEKENHSSSSSISSTNHTVSNHSSSITKRPSDPHQEKQIIRKLQEKVDDRDIEDKIAEIKQTSFWVPAFTPEAKESLMSEPDPRPRSPITGKFLRRKELVPVHFSVVDEEKRGGTMSEAGRYCCAVTRKEITNQRVVLLKPSGQVMLEDVAKKVAYPTMTCPISGKKIRQKDILKLASGGTSFSAHNAVEAKQYRPNIG